MRKENIKKMAVASGALAVAAVLVVVLLSALIPRFTPVPASGNAASSDAYGGRYDGSLSYIEAPDIKVPVDAGASLGALCLLPDGGAAVSGGSSIFIFDRSRSPTRVFSVTSPVTAMALKPDASETALYLALHDHLEIWSVDGRRLDEWTSLGEKAHLSSLAATNVAVYAADAGNRNIVQYDPCGRLIRFITPRNQDGAGFLIPGTCFDIAVGKSGVLWAVDPGRRRVHRLSPDGKTLFSWGRTSTDHDGFYGCCNPANIALFPDGSFAVQEKGILRIKRYDRNGVFQGLIAGPQGFHESLSSMDIAVGADGTVYVLDSHRGAVRIFVKNREE